jgi:hypothetical protein
MTCTGWGISEDVQGGRCGSTFQSGSGRNRVGFAESKHERCGFDRALNKSAKQWVVVSNLARFGHGVPRRPVRDG